ncbi:tetratricopeptide repeat protein 28 [Hydra vulgaris]|uniref:tetratricopeptide repeat protein 28 n=1 Tax=Hydra vulgaris TaxID=6087 RepID=UPI001F5F3030|nr:tetratricopeptide repeat protein 28-like [Hydra vulgaris]
MSQIFIKLLDEVRAMRYEKVDNNPDDYRFSLEDPNDTKRKLKYLEMHQKKAEDFNKSKEILDCISHKALAYFKLKNFEKFEELTVLQHQKSIEEKDDMRLRQALSNLGVIYKMKGQFGKALENYNKALEMATKRGEQWCVARLYNNIASVHELMMNYEKAIEFYQKRLEVANKLNDLDGAMKANLSMGGLYHTIDNLEKSIECYEAVQGILRKKLKNFETLADDAAGSDDDYVDLGPDEEEEEKNEEEKDEKDAKGKTKKCTIS